MPYMLELILIYLSWYQSQTSFLASNKNLQQAKKILTCTSLSEVTHVCLLDLDSMASCSRHGSVLCQNPTTKQCLSLSDLCTSRLHLSKPTPQTCSQASREENPEIRSTEIYPRAAVSSGKSPTRRLRFLTSRLSSWYTRRPDGLLIHRFRESEIPALIRPYTRPHAPLGFLASPSRASGLSTRLPRAGICY